MQEQPSECDEMRVGQGLGQALVFAHYPPEAGGPGDKVLISR